MTAFIIPYLFKIYRGDKTLQKSEITEETYVKLKAPTFAILVSSIISITFSIAFIIFGIKDNEKAIEQRLTINEWQQTRKIDSISANSYRITMEYKMNSALKKLDLILEDPKYKSKFNIREDN